MMQKKWIGTLFLLFGTITVFGMLQLITEKSASVMDVEQSFILIDAGHGGKDGGATAADGTKESDLNLAIATSLRDMLHLCGYTVQMTRTEDTAILHNDDTKQRSWKVQDMYNRLELYNLADCTISIHQNHFSQQQYSGAQLFYSPVHPKSKEMATCMREQIVRLLQPNNTREIKSAGKNIFLLHNTKKPAVIVECGFLSNADEAARLQDPVYQQQMAFAVCCGILQYAP